MKKQAEAVGPTLSFSPALSNLMDRPTSQIREIVQGQFVGALFDYFSIAFFFLVLGTLYRARPLLKGLAKANSWEWRRFVILNQIVEIARDLAFVLRCLFVLGNLYPAFTFVLDISEAWKMENAYLKMRRIAREYVDQIIKDMLFVCSWLSCKVAYASILDSSTKLTLLNQAYFVGLHFFQTR
jgi:hypothetical protein